MALPLYLAMTAAEIRDNSSLPGHLAYMACHFSPYGTGLSNRPGSLPQGSMLLLNDRTPIHGHDHSLIAAQLKEIITNFSCSCILLDFQRPGCEETAKLTRYLSEALPCPVGVSHLYAEGLACPVFLPPAPLDVPLTEYLQPWQGREIWLEAALDGKVIALTADGAAAAPLSCGIPSEGRREEALHCHYTIDIADEQALFTLFRTREDLDDLLVEAEHLGVTLAVGLWQELE